MVPAGDFLWNKKLKDETFLYTNINPQTAVLNRGIWANLENRIRSKVVKNAEDAYIVTGAVFNSACENKIGPNELCVPVAFFKIVYFERRNSMFAFLFDNTVDNYEGNIAEFQVSVNFIEQITREDFFDLMIEKKYNTNNIILKKIILVLSILLLINPVVLFIIFDSIIIGICIPLATILLTFVLYQNKKTKPLSVLLFNVIFVLSLFLHAEAIFTANFSDYIIENLYEPKENYYFNLPYLKKTFRDKEFVVQYFTNRQGFRISSEDEPEISVTQVDWLFIGDSYTQGAQVQYEDLYTTKLYKSFPDKTILNAGISGWGLPEEFNYYKIEGKKYKPSKVILQVCNFNDFMNVKERKTGFSDYLMAHSNFARYLLYDLKYANPAELPLGRWVEPFYPSDKLNEEYNIFYKSSSEKKLEDLI